MFSTPVHRRSPRVDPMPRIAFIAAAVSIVMRFWRLKHWWIAVAIHTLDPVNAVLAAGHLTRINIASF